jgi:hypothetical protein
MAAADGHVHSGDACPCKLGLNLNTWTAAQYGHTARVAAILERDPGAAHKGDEYGRTPLHFAAQHGREDVVRLLLGAGARADAGSCGSTPLHRAAYAGHAAVCRFLLDAGADVNAQDAATGDLRTPLHKALDQGHAGVAALLRSRGAREDVTDARGMTPAQAGEALCAAQDAAAGMRGASAVQGEDGMSAPAAAAAVDDAAAHPLDDALGGGAGITIKHEAGATAPVSAAAATTGIMSGGDVALGTHQRTAAAPLLASALTLGVRCACCAAHVVVVSRLQPCGCIVCDRCRARCQRGQAAHTCSTGGGSSGDTAPTTNATEFNG